MILTAVVEEDILELGEGKSLEFCQFGVKANSLNRLSNAAEYVPKAFVISKDMVTRIGLSIEKPDDTVKLKIAYTELVQNTECRLIVRSSSTLEWLNGSSFAGLHDSIRDVTSYDELIEAIRLSYKSTKNPQLSKYALRRGVTLPEEHLGIIVQKQIQVEWSALAVCNGDSVLIEYYHNDIVDPIQGRVAPLFVERLQHGRLLQRTNGANAVPVKVRSAIKRLVSSISDSAVLQPIHLEIGVEESKPHLLQINYLGKHSLAELFPNEEWLRVESTESVLPTKAESMIMFSEQKLFRKKLQVYTGKSTEELIERISEEFSFVQGVTVRFSYQDEIGLPRGFARNSDELRFWFNSVSWSKEWNVIVHDYIDVRRSFELLLGTDNYLLEHIPGMWESDNEFYADVLFRSTTESKAWIYNRERKPLKGAFEMNSELYEKPVSKELINQWGVKLERIVQLLRRTFVYGHPLNFHFVEDGEGDWHFLNCRLGFTLAVPQLTAKRTHIVNQKSDLQNWDGESPIQLHFGVGRGDENEIVEMLSEVKPSEGRVIVVEFGLLSHPAIILREQGYQLVPNYLWSSDRRFASHYDTLSLDVGKDPVTRIMEEPALFENEVFKLVWDIDPIVKGHLLLMAKQSITSLAILGSLAENFKKLNEFVSNLEGFEGNGYFYVERGNARFCTSGFTDCHAHAHILPKAAFVENVIDLFVKRVNANSVEGLDEAVEIARRSDNEYFMLIYKGMTYLSVLDDNVSSEKQLIRNFFSERLA